MQTRWMILAGAVIVAAFLAGRAVPQDVDPSKIDMAEAMKKWQEACTPGKPHEMLAPFVGTWDTELKMISPGAAPMVSPGTTETKWLFEGRWLISRTKTSMQGMPFETIRILGYDNFRRKYVDVIVDSMTTHLLTSAGNWTQDGKSLITYGEMNEPMTGEVGKMVKYATRVLDADTHRIDVYDLVIGEGEKSKVLEFTMKRKK